MNRKPSKSLAFALGFLSFVVSLALGLLLHSGLPPARRAAVTLLESFLNRTFLGHFSVGELKRLDPLGARLEGATIQDPQGRVVLALPSVDVDFDLFDTIIRVARLHEKLSFVLERIEIDSPEVNLFDGKSADPSASPGLSLAEAFELRDQTPSATPTEQQVRVWLAEIRVREARGQAKLSALKEFEFHGDADGKLLIANSGVALDVSSLNLQVDGLVQDPALLTGSYRLRYPGPMHAEIDFEVGGMRGQEKIDFEAGKITAEGSLENLDPELLREVWPDSPVRRPVDFVHEVSGVLPRLGIKAELTSEDGVLSAEGRIRIEPDLEADLDLDADNFDLNTLRPEWPKSSLSLRSAVEIWGAEGQPVVGWNATILPGELEGIKSPAIDSAGTLDERGLLGTATIHERGLPVHVAFEKPENAQLDFEVRLKRTRLEQAPRIQSVVALRGELEGVIRGSLNGERLRLEPLLNGSSLAYGGFSLTNFTLRGSGETELKALDQALADVELKASEASLQTFALKSIRARAYGAYQEPKFEISADSDDNLAVKLQGQSRTDRLLIKNLTGEITGQGKPFRLAAQQISSFEGVHEVSGLVIESTGRLAANARMTANEAELHVEGKDVDLSRLGRILKLAPGTLEGKLDVRADGKLGHDSQAELELHIRDGGIQGVVGTTLDAQATVVGKTLQANADARVEGLGQGHAEVQLQLDGSPLALASYRDSVGRGRLDLRSVELVTLANLVGRRLPVVIEAGQAEAKVELEKIASSSLPSAHLELETAELALRARDAELASNGVDVHLRGDIDPEQDKVTLALRLEDLFGELLSSSGEVALPLRTWNRDLPNAEQVEEAIQEAELTMAMTVPKRELRDLPAPLSNWSGLDGNLEIRSVIRGTVNAPLIEGNIELRELRGSATSLTEPVGLTTKVRYEPATGTLEGQLVGQTKNQQIASGSVHVKFSDSSKTEAWTGRVQLLFDDAPLSLIQPLKLERMDGLLRGAVVFDRIEAIPEVRADLRVRRLSFLEQPLGDGQLRATTNGSVLSADAEFDDDFGTLRVYLEGKVESTPWALQLASLSPLNLRVEASRYDAAVLAPAFEGVLTDLRGALEGKLQAEVRIPEHGDDTVEATLTGNMRLTSGAMTPASMGLRLEDVDLDLEVAPAGGYNVVKLTNIRAKARSEVHNLKGKGVLYFRGFELAEGKLSLSQSQLPILSDGVKLADLTGQLTLGLKKEKDQLTVDLDVPELEANLPTSTDRELIELKENDTITVIGPAKPKSDSKPDAAEAGLPVVVRVHLGPRVRVKSSFASVRLEGEPIVRFDDELSIKGQIGLAQGGRLEVLGRVFIIDHGSVFFDDEGIANPLIDTSATWRASSGVLVRASLTGRAHNPRLEWSSDPPIAGGEPAIMALVLGGGTSSQAGNSGIAYGAAAINQVLGQSGVRGIEITAGHESQSDGQVARLSDRGWNSYAAAVQISEEVWFEGKYTRETGGSVVEQRYGFSGTVDWRFHPSWSARTEVGTLGLGLDLLWQYRY
jgi:hypothetical protein